MVGTSDQVHLEPTPSSTSQAQRGDVTRAWIDRAEPLRDAAFEVTQQVSLVIELLALITSIDDLKLRPGLLQLDQTFSDTAEIDRTAVLPTLSPSNDVVDPIGGRRDLDMASGRDLDLASPIDGQFNRRSWTEKMNQDGLGFGLLGRGHGLCRHRGDRDKTRQGSTSKCKAQVRDHGRVAKLARWFGHGG